MMLRVEPHRRYSGPTNQRDVELDPRADSLGQTSENNLEMHGLRTVEC